MDKTELERKLAAIPEEEPDEMDALMMKEAKAVNDGNTVSLSDVKDDLDGYNGKILVRIPRSLHRQLASDAKREGVSLNQYALYKLSR